MKKLLALVVVGCGLYLAVPGQAQPPLHIPNPKPGDQVEPLVGFPKSYVKKTQYIDVTGTLEWVKGGPDPVWHFTHFTGYQIQVNGIAYQLPNADDKAAVLLGERVRVKGTLTVVSQAAGRISNGKPVQMDARLFTDHRVSVTELAAAEPDYLSETVTVELRGKLAMDAGPSWPPRPDQVSMIVVNGKSYVLSFGNHATLVKFAAKYDGKTIVIRGRHGPKMPFTIKCQPPFELPCIDVREIEVIDQGAAHTARVVDLTVKIQGLPACPEDAFVAKDGTAYDLYFGKNDALRKKALANKGKLFRVIGVILTGANSVPNLATVHVSDVQPVVNDSTVQVTQHWEARGKLVEVHAVPKSMGFAGLWCMVEVNGTCYWLDFGRDVPLQAPAQLEELARKLVGQTVVVSGAFGPRGMGGPQAIHVDHLRAA